MFNLNREIAKQILGEFTPEQEELLAQAASGSMSEKDLFEKLKLDQHIFIELMKSQNPQSAEKAIFAQEVSEDELRGINVGYSECKEQYTAICDKQNFRYLHEYPDRLNCAATVEAGSWCGESDACYLAAICYIDLKHCDKAHL